MGLRTGPAPSKCSQMSPLLNTSLDSRPARDVSGSRVPGWDSTWLTSRGCQHPRLLTPVLPPCFKEDGAPVTWNDPPFLPAPPRSLGVPGLVKDQLSDQDMGIQHIPRQQPRSMTWDKQDQRRTQRGRLLFTPDFTGHGVSHDPGIRRPARCWSR